MNDATFTIESPRWTGRGLGRFERASAALGMLAVVAWTMTALPAEPEAPSDAKPVAAGRLAAVGSAVARAATAGRDTVIGGYGGMTDTHNSTVAITKPGQIDMTVRDFAWLGKPFAAPVYYGVRVQSRHALGGFASMVDFTHAKAIARPTDEAAFSGTRDGRPVPPKAKVGDVFRHLEFSHGHNMLTWNGLFRWPAFIGRLRPYVGVGAGIALPHTEIGFRDRNSRTYEYQFAGLVGQLLGGVEIDLGRVSVFFEYKFSYAPYEVPLSEEPRGHLLFTDLWRQFRAWGGGEAPSGGRLATTLATHHGIGGVLLRIGPTGISAR